MVIEKPQFSKSCQHHHCWYPIGQSKSCDQLQHQCEWALPTFGERSCLKPYLQQPSKCTVARAFLHLSNDQMPLFLSDLWQKHYPVLAYSLKKQAWLCCISYDKHSLWGICQETWVCVSIKSHAHKCTWQFSSKEPYTGKRFKRPSSEKQMN